MSAAPTILAGSKTNKTVKGMFLPGIRAWINDESPAKIFEKSRRIGATYGEAYDATSRRFRRTQPRDHDYWMSSADESSAAEFVEYCVFFARDLFGSIAEQFVEQIEDPDTGRVATAFCIRCPNGKRITAMTSNPRRFRSKGGDVCLDEYGFHDEPRAMYKAAEPCTRWGGGLRILSTHNGEDSEYNRLVKRCRRVLQARGYDPIAPSIGRRPWGDEAYEDLLDQAREMRLTPFLSFHRMTIEDAVAQGLVELINRVKGTEFTREAFVQDCRDSSIDDDAYLEEYMCTPAQGDKVWLTYATIERCEDEACPQPHEPLTGYTGGPAVVGVDVGRKHDLTMIWVLEAVGDVLWTRQVLAIENTPLPDQERVLAEVLRSVRLACCCVDKTGIGLGLFEHIHREFGASRIEGVDFTSKSKQALAVGIKESFEDRRVRIPADCRQIREGLHKVRKTTTGTGLIRFDAPRDDAGHADEFWGLALALEAGSNPAGPVEAFSAGKLAFAKGGLW